MQLKRALAGGTRRKRVGLSTEVVVVAVMRTRLLCVRRTEFGTFPRMSEGAVEDGRHCSERVQYQYPSKQRLRTLSFSYALLG